MWCTGKGARPADPLGEPPLARWRALASWVPMLVLLVLATMTLSLTLTLLGLT